MRFKASAIAALAMLFVTACGATSSREYSPSVPNSEDMPWFSVLQFQDMLAKSPAGALGNVRLGSQFWVDADSYPNVEVDGDLALFKPGPAERDYAYASYLFEADHAWESLWLEAVWQTPPVLSPQTNLWIGLVVFPEERIDWFGQESEGSMFIADAEPFTYYWNNGRYYVCVIVVVTGSEQAIIEEISLLDAKDDIYWEIESADPRDGGCRYISMALDATDEPRVAYSMSQGSYYAARENGAWTIETIYEGTRQRRCSLALDTEENPHLAYERNYEVGDDEVYYATKQGGAWSQQVAVTNPCLRLGNLVLDSTDNPHLVYFDYGDASVNHACLAETDWLIDRVKGPCDRYSSLFVTPGGIPHITYQASSMLWYAFLNGSTWAISNIDNEAGAGLVPALMHDQRGRIHIAYCFYGDSLAELRYAYSDGESGATTTVAAMEDTSENIVVLQIDSQDLPHIAYGENVLTAYGLDSLKYARFDGAVWLVETVYAGLQNPQSLSFALDSNDKPHFCFSADFPPDEPGICLYYARPR